MLKSQLVETGNLIELQRITGDDDNPRLPPEAMFEFVGHEKIWVSLEPGYTVRDGDEANQLVVEFALVMRQ